MVVAISRQPAMLLRGSAAESRASAAGCRNAWPARTAGLQPWAVHHCCGKLAAVYHFWLGIDSSGCDRRGRDRGGNE